MDANSFSLQSPHGRPERSNAGTLSIKRPTRLGSPDWNSMTLLKGATRAWIEHNGQTYCLQQTKQGKLILTK